jgi:hypothetical protein
MKESLKWAIISFDPLTASSAIIVGRAEDFSSLSYATRLAILVILTREN